MSTSVPALRHDEILSTLDERTLDIIHRRRHAGTLRRRGWLVRRALLAADLVGLVLAFLIAQWLYPNSDVAGNRLDQWVEFSVFCLSLPGFVVAAKLYGLYDKDEERADHSTTDDFAGVFHLVTVCTWLLYGLFYITRWAHPQFPKLLLFWGLAVVSITLARAGARAYCRRQVQYIQNTVVVGAGDVGQMIARKLLKHHEYGLNLVGFVDGEPKARVGGLDHLTLLGDLDRLPEIVRLLDVERVIFAFSNDTKDDCLDAIRMMNDLDVQVDIVPRFFEVLSPGADVHTVEGVPMWALPPARLSRSSKLIKRGFDVIVSALGVVVLAPLFAVVALAIKLDSRGPVIFRQVRMGSDDNTFFIWKFRTMVQDADERKHEVAHLNKHLLDDPRMFKIASDPRVTGVGRFLRRFSLDELPQLVNVLRGDMSLVGPRPLILDEDQHVIAAWARRRLDLRPGITGLWQVLGRSDIPFDDMVRLDYLYITNWSLSGDIKLLLRTASVPLRHAD